MSIKAEYRVPFWENTRPKAKYIKKFLQMPTRPLVKQPVLGKSLKPNRWLSFVKIINLEWFYIIF